MTASVNPLDGMPKANEKADRKRIHRAMTEAGLVTLLLGQAGDGARQITHATAGDILPVEMILLKGLGFQCLPPFFCAAPAYHGGGRESF
jgi:hypothetical protein